VNTGLRGQTLAGVLERSGAGLLVVGERFLGRIEAIRKDLDWLRDDDILVLPARGESPKHEGPLASLSRLEDRLLAEVGASGEELELPEVEVSPASKLMVIYTSGTTGLPKGIINSHFKLLTIGSIVAQRLDLTASDRGYACMPLFHSNAMFLGFHPALSANCSLALRPGFSASRFVPDVLRHGVTYWNYVGEPVHYVLESLEAEYGGDEERIRAEVTEHPGNRLRHAVGNGAAPLDIERFSRWLGLDDMFELYGSTESAISTFRKKGDPRGSVGEIQDPAVRILSEAGEECPPAEIDASGRIENYADAVGEICRVAPDSALFQGYFDDAEATSQKHREGVYHSGDLGHVLERGGKRYLFFDGRTDDWIRKDGENFSAAQVARAVHEHPDVALAAAYGVPCAVSDELVMIALQLREGASFDPQGFFDYCRLQAREGGMDDKWFPDFVRIVAAFSYTETKKILVRKLKSEHFDLRRLEEAEIYWRSRESTSYAAFRAEDFDALRARFLARERADLLDR
jgi:fatty-acyl-CoA synthase